MPDDASHRPTPPAPSGGSPPSLQEPTVISQRPPVHAVRPDTALNPRQLGETLVGKKLAQFQLTEFVGGGGMGAVFRATDTMLNRTVAVKVLSRDQGSDEETVRRFQNEAQSAARLDHENIARVYYVGEDDGWYFIVFEFIEGKNLRELVNEQGPMPLERALQVTLQVASALDHSAQREVVHRDIKPSNVLLTPQGKAKLVDMGLARLRPLQSDNEDLTASGVTLGTFDYISPEQARDPRTADVRSDIYSLGCTLYFMLTGQPPFPEGTVLQKLLSHSGEAPPNPRRLRPDLPPELIPLMNKMLAKKPTERYARPVDLIADLVLLAERLGLPATAYSQAIWISDRATWWSRLVFHLPWSLAVMVLLLLTLFWNPAWLDGSAPQGILPRFVAPASVPLARPNEPTVPAAPPIRRDDQPAEDSADTSPDTAAPNLTGEARSIEQTPPVVANPRNLPPEIDTPGDTAAADPGLAPNSRPDDPRPARSTRPVEAVAPATRRLVVDASPNLPRVPGELVVGDLADACRLAQQNPAINTIEVRQQGRVAMSPLTLSLEGRSLKLVAAEGCTPWLSFNTGSSASERPSAGMIRLIGGQLQIEGLHLEMTIPNDALDGEWALFQLENTSSLQIRQSTLSVHNSYGGRFSNLDHIAVFSCLLPDRQEMLAPDMGQPRDPIVLQLDDCVVRCEATLLRAPEALPIRLQWTNGLLVSSERLASLGGATQRPREGERMELTLRQLTAVVDQGLAELASSPSRAFLMPVVVDSQACIWVAQRWATLIQQSGPQTVAASLAQLDFRGRQNAYDGLESFWKITPQEGDQAESYDFERWRARWNDDRASWQQVPWRIPLDKNRPIHELRLADFALAVPTPAAPPGETAAALPGLRAGDLPQMPETERARPRKTRPFFQF